MLKGSNQVWVLCSLFMVNPFSSNDDRSARSVCGDESRAQSDRQFQP